MANREKKRKLNRKQVSRLDIERRQRQYVLIGTIAIVAVVIITVIIGIVLEGIIKPRQPVAQVGELTISTRDYQAFTRYQRFRLVNEYLSTFQFIQNMGDPNSASYFESYLLQIQNQLEPEVLGLNAINQMVENEIVKMEAENLGIEVSEAEVERRIQEVIFQYYPKGSPTPEPTNPALPTPTLSELQKTLVLPTPTDVITGTQTDDLETEEVIDPVDTTEDNVSDATPTLMPTTALPTPTTYTERAFNQDYRDYLGYLRSNARISEKDIFNYFESAILREKVAKAVISDIPSEEEKLWARHILFRDIDTGKAEAEAFLARISAGEDFVQVAEELSANAPELNEGESAIIFEDLGWFGEGMMVAPFETAAQELEIGEISEPIQTTFGWHVIQLLGRDVQPRTTSQIEQLREETFQAWLAEKQLEYQVDISPDWIDVVPVEPEIPPQARISAPQ